MSAFSDLSKDPEFKKRWPYVWTKLEPYLLAMQRDYATAHKGQHEQIGQFVEFMSELMTEFNTIDIEMERPEPLKRPRLHNVEFRQ